MSGSGPIFLPKGFTFSAIAAGIKSSKKPDLALIVTESRATAAALFTKNRIVAAPVEVDRASLGKTKGRVRAVIVNSGNANCATGPSGLRACKLICAELAQLLNAKPSEVFPSSTGIIGVSFPAAKITSYLKPLLAGAGASVEHLRQLATMLVYLLTDVIATPAELRNALRKACDQSFNVISIDGDTSTNDTVLLLASGRSRITLRNVRTEFENALHEVCQSLAEQIVADGEGVQHVIQLHIEQAKNQAEALQVARTISHSLLVKTAWAGADPNWGRILAAVGRSGVVVEPGKISVLIGNQAVCRGAVACKFDEQRAHADLSMPECSITVRLGRGKSSLKFLTTDLTQEYVKINADYST